MEEGYRSPVNGRKFRDATFDLLISLGSANIDFEVRYQNEVAGVCKAQYMEDA